METPCVPCEFGRELSVCVCVCIYIYIYIYILSHGSIVLEGLGLLYEVPLSLRKTTLGRTPLDK